MADISLRNAEIRGIYHDRESYELFMYALLPSGQKCELVFQAVEWWELCSFGMENILSIVDAHDTNSLTKAVINEQDIADQYVKMVQDGPHKLFVLHASAGLSGWVIAGKMIVKPTQVTFPLHT